MSGPHRESLLSRLTFAWIGPLIRHAHQIPPGEDDFPPLPDRFDSEREARMLEKEYDRLQRRSWALPVAIARTFKAELAKVVPLSLLGLAAATASPLILRRLLQSLEGTLPAPAWFSAIAANWIPSWQHSAFSALCAVGLFISSSILILIVHHLFFIQPIAGGRVNAALRFLIFKHALKQKRSSSHDSSSGFVLNLTGTDCTKIQLVVGFLHSLWYHPLQLCIAITLLYILVGYAALIGTLSLAALLVVSIVISRKQLRLRREISKIADRRVGLTHESITHIKAAKFQGWELNLTKKISDLRLQEVTRVRALARLTAIMLFIAGSGPAIAMAVTCAIAVNDGIKLDAATIFPMLSLFMLLRFALNHLPEMISNWIDAKVAIARIHSFLSTETHTPLAITPDLPNAIELSDASFAWSEDRLAVTVPDLCVGRGELVVVVGSIGSGKSALLLGLLGELSRISGTVAISGSVGYVPQAPWIISDTVRGNILCGQPFDSERYWRIIQASGLEGDLNLLSQGDLTEIGERGVNLSGGQRHRVALARAAYANAEIFLLDDPLSALDPGVANHVFRNLIKREMCGSTKILVSHRVEYAMLADQVIVIENGAVVERGSPEALQRLDSRFSQLLRVHDTMTKKGAIEKPVASSKALPSIHEPFSDASESEAEPFITAEDRVLGGLKRGVIREYFKRLAPGPVIVTLVCLFVSRQLASVGADIWLTQATAQGLTNIHGFLGVYIGLVIMMCVATYARSMYLLHRGLSAAIKTHQELLRGVLHAPMRFFESNPVGRIINRFSRDLETVEIHLPRSIMDAGHCIFETLSAFLVIAFVKPLVIIFIAPATLGYYRIQKLYRPLARESQRLLSMTLSPIFALLSESLAGVEAIRAARLRGVFEQRFTRFLDAHNRMLYSQTANNRWLGIRLEFLGCCIILFVGLASALSTQTTLSTAFSGLMLSYATFVTSSMNWALRSLAMAESSLTCFERMERYADTPSERLTGITPPTTWPEKGAVRFVDLSARYRPELPLALKNLNIEIPAGSRVGIIGRTGSGKSTLILTIMRLLEPESGHVEVDGLNLSDLNLASVRAGISIVPQEPVLFSGYLRESLDPFAAYSDEQILDALNRAHLGSFIKTLPRGLKTRVREGGFNFSSGQRQLLCLARALLRKSHLIILDEATAAMDVESDLAIQQTIRREFKGATLLVIAHRLGTVLDSDIILGLRNGELVESGSPTTLLATPGSLLSEFIHELQSTLTG